MDHADIAPIAELLEERRHLLDVAYWMLGSPSEAESVVDETYRRWYLLSDAARKGITAPRSWLAKTAGGICLNRLVLPEWADDGAFPGCPPDGPRATDPPPAPPEEVGSVVLDALDSLPPTARAAFVLNDVFGMSPDTVADIVGRTESECAELADRARRYLRIQRARPTTPKEHDILVRAIRQACMSRDAELLAALLSPDATASFDGGGKVRASSRPVRGGRQVADSLLTLLARRSRTTLSTHSVNGRTGLVARYDHQVAAVITFDIADHLVAQVWIVLNPDKLHSWNRT
ncbi:sigma factor-like helix-turn-helix DNA-binding protein [Streptomyces sp. WAC07094]|uniref:sigma factor-like helix-turn-helix DNA-binding protein n=1 Tax=unclassified Streptomyces TaxID=2593676 RepID=UPI002EAB16D3|nr:sigma factor-like helix-turn-helix DNA-binding protein [Streptomyces sp. WAC07094]